MIAETLGSLAGPLLATLIVWRYYRGATFPRAEKYATFWPRLWTGTVDSCVLWPLTFLDSLVSSLHPKPMVVVVSALVQNLAILTYTVWMHAARGQTVGKIVCRVRVVDHVTEGSISLRQAFLRECVPAFASLGAFVYALHLYASGALAPDGQLRPGSSVNWKILGPLLAAPVLWFFVEVVTMFSNPKRRALHDLIAGTTVVRTHVIDV